MLLGNPKDPQWTDENGYRPKILILDNEFWGLNEYVPVLKTSLLDLLTRCWLMRVYSIARRLLPLRVDSIDGT
jgi:hypothetical protein